MAATISGAMNPFSHRGPKVTWVKINHPHEPRFTDRQKIVMICIGSALVGWMLLGVPNLVAHLAGKEVYPLPQFDWWWLWIR